MSRFEGKFILISGGGSGIGLACAQQVAGEGGRVGLLGRRQEILDAAIEQLEGAGHVAVAVDCADEGATKVAIKGLREHADRFDGAVLSAGQHELRPLSVTNNAHFEEVFRGNVLTAVNVARSFAKAASREGASVVLLSSAAAMKGGAGAAAYSAAKAGLIGMGRVLAHELAVKKIRVNSVVPGVVETEMTERFFSSLAEEQVNDIRKKHLLGLGQPNDVAAAVTFLLSPEARWITGTQIVVDGGYSC